MSATITSVVCGPWALLPDRLPFVHTALDGLSISGGQGPSTDAAKPKRRKAGNGDIAVLPFYGVAVQRADAYGETLGLLSLWRFTQALRAALADDLIGSIVIDIDSPGGSVYGVAELADEIYRARGRKPIAAVANSLAGSGAYWVGSAASEFYVTPSGEVGGIGVVAMHQDISKALGKAGVETTLIFAGRYKTEGSTFQPLGADARAAMRTRVDDYYRAFVAAVAKHRNVSESAVRNGMGQGRLLGAEPAKRERMADGVATLDKVLDRLMGLTGPNLAVPCAGRLQALPHTPDASNQGCRCNSALRARSVRAYHRDIDLLTL